MDRAPLSTGLQNKPNLKEFHAIGMTVGEHLIKLDRDYNISLSTVSIDLKSLSQSLVSLFDRLRSFTEIARVEPAKKA